MPRGIVRCRPRAANFPAAAGLQPGPALRCRLAARPRCADITLGLILTVAFPFVVAPGEQCQAKDAVYLQAASGAQQGISLFFVCCQCNHMWVYSRPYPAFLLRC